MPEASTRASVTLSERSGSFTVSWLPINTPGIEPIRTTRGAEVDATGEEAANPGPVKRSWKRSVPKSGAVGGGAIIITSEASEPTGKATMKMPSPGAGAPSCRPPHQERATGGRRNASKGRSADHERDPEHLLPVLSYRRRSGRRAGRQRHPEQRRGAEPVSIHIASRAWTCPSWRCLAAPNDLKIAPCRMSVPIATVGLKPKTRISIGVIREPPPIPVMPTRRPIRRPATDSFQSTT